MQWCCHYHPGSNCGHECFACPTIYVIVFAVVIMVLNRDVNIIIANIIVNTIVLTAVLATRTVDSIPMVIIIGSCVVVLVYRCHNQCNHRVV